MNPCSCDEGCCQENITNSIIEKPITCLMTIEILLATNIKDYLTQKSRALQHSPFNRTRSVITVIRCFEQLRALPTGLIAEIKQMIKLLLKLNYCKT